MEILLPLLIITIIIMNMQNKLYTIQFSHHPMTDSVSVPKQPWRNAKLMNFATFEKHQKIKKQTPRKIQTPTQERI